MVTAFRNPTEVGKSFAVILEIIEELKDQLEINAQYFEVEAASLKAAKNIWKNFNSTAKRMADQ